jgi:hypothetical protein
MGHVSLCYWNSDQTCRHPKVGNTPASPERCNQCVYFKKRMGEAATAQPQVPVQLSWAEKAKSYVQAEVSLVTDGPLDKDEYLLRLEVCNACPMLKPAEEPDKLGWCTGCSCPMWGRSELTVKARMPKATCPQSKWNGDSARAPLPEGLRGAINA